jgi:hypothetical protein
MTVNAKMPADLKSPVAVPRQKPRKSAPGKETGVTSPIERMQGKLTLKDPELTRRIISDPSLEPA